MLALRFATATDPTPVEPSPTTSHVHVWYNRAGGIVARGYRRAGFGWMAWPRLATFRFAPHDAHITAFPEPGAPVDVVWDTYRRSVLPIALQAHGLEALHASAVVVSSGVVGFCAASETGKSTIAYGLRGKKFPQWSDDGVVFRIDDEGARALPLPFEVRLRPESRQIFGDAAPLAARFQHNGPGEQIHTAPTQLSALCLLERTESGAIAAPRVRRLDPPEAFSALLAHAHVFDPTDQARLEQTLRTYLELVAQVPVFTIQFPPVRERFNDLLDSIIDTMALEAPERSSSLCEA